MLSNNYDSLTYGQRSIKWSLSYQARKELSGKWSHSYIHVTVGNLGSDFFIYLFVMGHKMC